MNTQGYQIAAGLAVYAGAFGSANWMWLRRSGVETTAVMTVICCLPAMLTLLLAATSLADYRQYVVRLLACAMFTPILLLFWSGSQEPAVGWPFLTGAGVAHALAFVAAIFWLGTNTTRVEAVGGVAPVDAETLTARLVSLPAGVARCDAQKPAAFEVVVRFRAEAGRLHAVMLRLDTEQHAVHVRERLTADAARPVTAAEASLRGLGEPAFDPSRPEAASISGKVAQTTMIEPARLQAIPLTLDGRTAKLPADFTAGLDGEGLVTALCAVVTRSGWNWQPEFFESGDR